MINANFDQIRNLSDSLIFEFGANWAAKRNFATTSGAGNPSFERIFFCRSHCFITALTQSKASSIKR